jgi:Cu-Zn family superoxide dismutase
MNRGLLAAAVVTALSFGCAMSGGQEHDHSAHAQGTGQQASPLAGVKNGIAVLHPTEGNKASGIVRFTQTDGGVKVVAEVSGLTPNGKHGFHVHEFGDCSDPKAESAGGHYDPMKTKTHGKPTSQPVHRHAGDMGNLTADADGKATLELTLEGATIGGENAIVGRSVIVHAKEDNFGQPTGNAGGRIACGVIGVAKAPAK